MKKPACFGKTEPFFQEKCKNCNFVFECRRKDLAKKLPKWNLPDNLSFPRKEKDVYDRVIECPECGDYRYIAPIHVPQSNSRYRCFNCGFTDRVEYFRAIPEKALKTYNPSRRDNFEGRC